MPWHAGRTGIVRRTSDNNGLADMFCASLMGEYMSYTRSVLAGLLLFVGIGGCAGAERSENQNDTSEADPRGVAVASEGDSTLDTTEQVLFESDGTRLYIVGMDANRHLVWDQKANGTWSRFWMSDNLYHGFPEFEFADLNGDAVDDLFWSMEYEEIVGGMVVFNAEGRPVERPLTLAQCAAPVLKKDTAGYLITAFGPALYSKDKCRDVDVGICDVEHVTTWPHAFRIVGLELQEEQLPSETYSVLAEAYLHQAAKLDSLMREGTRPRVAFEGETYESMCGKDFAVHMRVLADSARRLAN